MSGYKLLQLNVTANWGSTGKIAEGIGLAAMSRGWESYIAYGRYMNPSQSQLIKVGNKFDVYSHYARNRFFDGEGLGSKKATHRLIAQIDELTPDIIQLHNIHDHWLNYPALFKYLATIDSPVVWTFHDCWAFTGGCYHFEDNGCYKWRQGRCESPCHLKHKMSERNYSLKRELLGALGERLTVVAVSQWMAEYAKESFLRDSHARIEVLNNGINLDTFKPSGSEKEKMILGVSNIWPKSKGLDDFVRLRQILADDIAITVVGLSEQQVKTLPEGITGMTRTASASELARIYAKASAFVNPTYSDSFPTVNLEALACGTPVITYRTGGSPEAVDGQTGVVVEKGNVEALAEAIMDVIGNPGLYTSENCRERTERNFNQDIQFGKYINLYSEIIK